MPSAAHQHQRWQEEIEEKRDDDEAVTAEAPLAD